MADPEARAAAAKRLREDPLLVEALANIRLAAIERWEGTAESDTQARELAWLTVKASRRLEAELESIITNGLIAARRVQAPVR